MTSYPLPGLVAEGDEDGRADGAAWHTPPAAPAATPAAPAASAWAAHAPGSEVLVESLVQVVVIVIVSPIVIVLMCHVSLLDL